MILLDTHAWIWWASGDRALSARARSAVERESGEGGIRVSSISVWEAAMLVLRGRLELTIPVEDWILRCEAIPSLEFVPVDNRIALESTRLPGRIHADPADRLIVATAMLLRIPLVTMDRRLRRYRHVRTIW